MVTPADLVLAQKFSEAIKNKKLVQKQVEGLTGLSQQIVSDLKSGNKHFTNEIIFSIVNGLKLDLIDFVNIDNDSNEETSEDNKHRTNIFNDKKLVNELVKSKDETKIKQNEIIQMLKEQNHEKEKKIERRDKKIEELKRNIQHLMQRIKELELF